MSKHCKIPKRIAGVKIPKSLRKGAIGDFLRSSNGRALLAEAVAGLETITGRGGLADGERLGRAFRAGLEAFRAELSEHDFLHGAHGSHAPREEKAVIRH